MCGIAGVFNLNGEPVSPVALKRMTDAIAHRGPDGEGFFIDSFIGLGHRRLAIIDLSSAGHQPMLSPDKQFALTYNGEVYNFRELRAELQSVGHRFQSATDSEVVLHAYMEWGPACLDRFNGMFAFAIWDKTRQQLFLARDRYGVKPLYYGFVGSRFLFASEQKAILTDPEFPRKIDAAALLEYFTFQNLFTNRTMLEGLRLLPAGCFARLSVGAYGAAALAPHIERYWDFSFAEPKEPFSEAEAIEELDRLFQQAVVRQLVSDVEIGAYLSGGMDSGSITAIAARNIPNLKSFTCGFDLHSASGLETAFDEREYSESLSYLLKTEHYEMVLKAGDMERIMPKFAWHLEEPRVGQSYPNFYVAKLASKFVKVVLSGAGGDEFFGGYPWRYFRAVACDGFEDYIDKYYLYWQRLVDNRYLKRMFQPLAADVSHVLTRDIFRDVFAGHPTTPTSPEDYVNHSLYLEAKTFLHGLLVVEDKLSMAHGLETRVPFLDNDLVDFAMRVPVRLKLGRLDSTERINENIPSPGKEAFRRASNGKMILRKMMERYVPRDVTERPKQGFSAPDASWFRGESIDYVRRVLESKEARLWTYLDRDATLERVREHLDGTVNRRLLVWSLLNIEAMLRAYFP